MQTRDAQTQPKIQIRPLHYGDLESIMRLCAEQGPEHRTCSMVQGEQLMLSPWRKLLGWLPLPWRKKISYYVADSGARVHGVIRVSPFNRSQTTWRIDQIAAESTLCGRDGADAANVTEATLVSASDVGSELMRYCLEKIWQARTWVLELDVSDRDALALYRQNGFQLLAQMTYWSLAVEQLQELAIREPDLPNLRSVSNADAPLLYQLDNMALPPLVRQVFDRHPQDFKTNLLESLVSLVQQWMSNTETVSGYVFEPQRQVAIGYFQLHLCRDGSQAHQAHLTVHPAYTWLYPELMVQMARITQDVPAQSLQIVSADYHPEREEYLQQIGAQPIAHTMMMSRSVWHKLREAQPATLETLQLTDMLQGLQPAQRPVPGRISILKSIKHPQPKPARRRFSDNPHHGDPTGC
ncbi:GNAT family N-acetyltransferase [Romeriopsis navalis]|nr:GNAT family N-acetyltransferase [Romeriopsis navalis]